jgi:hypothetical protein
MFRTLNIRGEKRLATAKMFSQPRILFAARSAAALSRVFTLRYTAK